jgi:DNA-binding beta-propeller fold protein YncE
MKSQTQSRTSAAGLLAVALVLAALIAFPQADATRLLKKIASIELPGPAGKRFDYLAIDPDDHYLFVAHLGAGNLYVLDLQSLKVLHTISPVPGVEGVTYVPELKKVYTSNWYEDRIGVIDLRMMKIIKRIPTESKPDGSAYAAPFHKLYVSNELGKSVSVVDVARDEVIRTLRFESETGMPQYDPVARKIYVNLQDQNLLAVIDPTYDAVIARYPVGRCQGNHGMALDPEHRRAFLSCEKNNVMTVIDLERYLPVTFLAMPSGADVIAFDPGLGRIYVACYSGSISVFQQKDPDHYDSLGNVPVANAVHSLSVDPETHRVFAPEQEESGMPVSRLVVFEAAK